MNENILDEFSERLNEEIEASIRGRANFLSALGLSCYTEYIGGLSRKKLKTGESKKNYNCGLKLMGEKYAKLVGKYKGENSMYIRVRCGLVHEYFIKKSSIVWREREPPSGCGIEVDNGGVIIFYSRKYFNDLKGAIAKLIERSKKDTKLSKYITDAAALKTIDASGVIRMQGDFISREEIDF